MPKNADDFDKKDMVIQLQKENGEERKFEFPNPEAEERNRKRGI